VDQRLTLDLERQRRGQGGGDLLGDEQGVVDGDRELVGGHARQNLVEELTGHVVVREVLDSPLAAELGVANDVGGLERLGELVDERTLGFQAARSRPGWSNRRSQTIRLNAVRSISPARQRVPRPSWERCLRRRKSPNAA